MLNAKYILSHVDFVTRGHSSLSFGFDYAAETTNWFEFKTNSKFFKNFRIHTIANTS